MEEPQLRSGNQRIRPFVQSANIHHRGTSRPLQRVVTDFAADVSFAQTMDKLVEHYGVLLSESSIRRITEHHAQQIYDNDAPQDTWPQQPGCDSVIAEMDGGMVPIVEPDPAQTDQRKGKRLHWKEAKLCLAHAQGSRSLVYGGTLQGDVNQAGQALFDCAVQAGFGQQSQLHAVGDGAEWIASQVEDQFGANGYYLVDFYHVCDYLSAAAKAIHPDGDAAVVWLDVQKARLKSQQADETLSALHAHLEAADVPEADAPVRRCHRYLTHRRHQLDYQSALARELPIGSGEIESAHRYIVQQRLKRPGAWWRAQNAEHMLALRLNRANQKWHDYWARDYRLVA